MHQFFVDSPLTDEGIVQLPNETLRQIRTVLKLHAGEKIWLSDTQRLVEAELQSDGTAIVQRLLSVSTQRTPIILYAALIRKERFEWMLQKATELGVDLIVPVLMERNVVKWEEEPRKMLRYAAILKEASEQCHRVDIPKLDSPIKLKALIQHQPEVALVAYEQTENTVPLTKVSLNGASIGILIGPEGGISSTEMTYLRDHGWIPVGLGSRTLRAETAALVAITLLTMRIES